MRACRTHLVSFHMVRRLADRLSTSFDNCCLESASKNLTAVAVYLANVILADLSRAPCLHKTFGRTPAAPTDNFEKMKPSHMGKVRFWQLWHSSPAAGLRPNPFSTLSLPFQVTPTSRMTKIIAILACAAPLALAAAPDGSLRGAKVSSVF